MDIQAWRDLIKNGDPTVPPPGTPLVTWPQSRLEKLVGDYEKSVETQTVLWKEGEDLARRLNAKTAEADAVYAKYSENLKQVADLKERLHALEVENARLTGYLDRVSEDDAVRDGFHEIKESDGTTMMPKRPARRTVGYNFGISEFDVRPVSTYDSYEDRERKKNRVHWVNYPTS